MKARSASGALDGEAKATTAPPEQTERAYWEEFYIGNECVSIGCQTDLQFHPAALATVYLPTTDLDYQAIVRSADLIVGSDAAKFEEVDGIISAFLDRLSSDDEEDTGEGLAAKDEDGASRPQAAAAPSLAGEAPKPTQPPPPVRRHPRRRTPRTPRSTTSRPASSSATSSSSTREGVDQANDGFVLAPARGRRPAVGRGPAAGGPQVRNRWDVLAEVAEAEVAEDTEADGENRHDAGEPSALPPEPPRAEAEAEEFPPLDRSVPRATLEMMMKEVIALLADPSVPREEVVGIQTKLAGWIAAYPARRRRGGPRGAASGSTS